MIPIKKKQQTEEQYFLQYLWDLLLSEGALSQCLYNPSHWPGEEEYAEPVGVCVIELLQVLLVISVGIPIYSLTMSQTIILNMLS